MEHMMKAKKFDLRFGGLSLNLRFSGLSLHLPQNIWQIQILINLSH